MLYSACTSFLALNLKYYLLELVYREGRCPCFNCTAILTFTQVCVSVVGKEW